MRQRVRIGLAAAMLVVVGASGAAAIERRRPPVVPLAAVDSAGKLVGPVLSSRGPDVVVGLRAGTVVTLVFVSAARITGQSRLVFESNDCSGTPFVGNAFTNGVLAALAVTPPFLPISAVGPGNVLFVSNGPLEDRTLLSVWNTGVQPPICETLPASPPISVFPAAATTFNVGTFTPPFSVR